ncbi:MAG: N-6 DNA methylase [Candidatus ainarchaeum sp.]|nr:N-6 DNA methylase [Candidatus ainarchaeum sp.]
MEKNEARAKLAELVEKYRRYESAGKLKGLNEADTKAVFIEPLFEALGWDVRNLEEVSREESVLKGRADYAFRLSGVIRFFVEAKSANAPLEEKEAWQAIRYAYSRSVPWAVLTSFTELVIYSSEWKATRSEESRFLRFTVDEYVSRFDELWMLGREGMAEGSLNTDAERVGRKLKREPVGTALFKDFMEWRTILAKEVEKHDPRNKLSKDQIDEGVQRFLNRLIFIRTCEDRGFENEQLREIVRVWREKRERRITRYVGDMIEGFNYTYDSDIFSPHMAGELLIENDVMERVISELYDYDFKAIDADVLGNIYEQYLATILRKGGGLLDRGAKRKEMGIYYTPTYIVDYIVKNTLGELISKARKPEDLQKIRVLDPACGSGSFLIRAYDALSHAYEAKNGGDHALLSGNVSRNASLILTKNLHGVDLDRKAIEIAELNLLLRAATRRGLLPMLSDNIKQGNSLISGTEEELEKYFGPHWRDKHPFNWEDEFPEVMKEGGFDVIIGNPPYERLKQLSDKKEMTMLTNYFADIYAYQRGNLNLYKLFLERCFKLLKPGGYFAMIFPTAFLGEESSAPLRKLFFEGAHVISILQFPESAKVFGSVTQDVTVLVYKKEKKQDYPLTINMNRRFETMTEEGISITKEELNLLSTDYQIPMFKSPKVEIKILERISAFSPFGGDPKNPPVGITREGQLHETNDAEFMTTDPTGDLLIKGIHLDRYFTDLNPRGTQPRWVKKKAFLKKKPNVSEALQAERIIGMSTLNKQAKRRFIFSILPPGYVITNNVKYLNVNDMNLSPDYVLGLLNSKLLEWRFRVFSQTNRVSNYEVESLPIVRASKEKQSPIADRAKRLLELRAYLNDPAKKAEYDYKRVEAEAARLEREIDELVYDLYGLTAEERAVVEESFKERI